MSRIASINGAIVPLEQATISVLDRGFLYGDGVFDTVRVYGGRPFAAGEHVERLARSAATLRIPLPISVQEIARELEAAIEAAGEQEAVARLMLTRGASPEPSLMPRGELVATRIILVEPVRVPPREAYALGLGAITLAWGRSPDVGPAASAKLLPYVTSMLALEEARARGADDAIFLGPDGCVREAATSNVFLVDERGMLVSPSDGPGVLGGITRGQVLELACALGLSCSLESVPAAALARAREVFLTSSVREIISVVRVDGSAIGSGAPGEIARTLHRALRIRAGATGTPPWE